MLIRKVQQVGESLNINLPAQVCDMLGIEKGDSLRIDVEDKNIIIAPASPPRQTDAASPS